MRSLRTRSTLLSLAALVTFGTGASYAQQPYSVLDTWKIGGTGGWDYLLVDPAAHLLYITHGPRVEVVDTTTGKTVGAITGLQGTHGVALDPDGQTGYISDGRANQVVMFDRKTFAITGKVATGMNPDGIAFEPVTKTVWAFNGRSKDVSVINTATKAVVATIPLSGKPEFPQADGKGNVLVNIEDKNQIIKLDAKTNKATATWATPGCDSPSGSAIDIKHHRFFSVCDGKKMAITDSDSGKQIALANIGEGPDAAGYDSKHELAFASAGDGTLTVVDTKNNFAPLETVTTKKGARTMSYDEVADRVYLVTAEFGDKPAATAENPRPRPAIVPDSFQVVVVGRK